MADEQRRPTSTGEGTLRPASSQTSSRSTKDTLSSSSKEAAEKHALSSSNPDHDVERGIPIVDTTDVAVGEKENAHRITSVAPSEIHRIVSASGSNLVDWNDQFDIRRPINWTAKKKWKNCSVISMLTFLTPLASSMIAPSVPLLMKDFKTTNSTVGSFVVSIFLIGYVVGPLFIAPMSEIYGRLPVYHVCNVMFVIWNIACAVAPSMSSLLVFRLLAGIAGSCPITIFAGSIADVFIQEQRGAAMAICALGPLIGPVVGPVAGGFLGEAAGWRWNFWVISIAGGVVAIGSFILQRETYEPVLLQRLTNELIKETGNDKLTSKLSPGLTKNEFLTRALVRPTKMLIFSPIVLSTSIYMAVVYGYLYLLFTTLTLVYEKTYHFGAGPVGLVYLGIGIGSMVGLVIFGAASDIILKRLTAKSGTNEMKPEYRLPPLLIGSFCVPIGLFWYGWSVEKKIHWIMGIIGTGWVGVGMLSTFMSLQTYLVDAFTIHAASAVAANTVLRSLVGAVLPLAGPKMYATLGLGWGNSLLGFIALALSPIPWVFWKYGETIRKKYQVEF